MNKDIVEVIKHPKYYFCTHVRAFNNYIDIWHRVYGAHDEIPRKVFRFMRSKLQGQKEETITVCCVGDGTLYQYLKMKANWVVCGQDFSIKSSEFARENFEDNSIQIIDTLYLKANTDILVCNNVLNALEELDRNRYIGFISKQYNSILFVGEEVEKNRKALGPEPIGHFGCAQFATKDLRRQLEEHFSVVVAEKIDETYLYWVQCNEKK